MTRRSSYLFVFASGNYDLLNDEADEDILEVTLELASEPHTVLWKSDKEESEETFSISVKGSTHCEMCFYLDDKVDDDKVNNGGLPIGFNLRVHPAVERTLPEGEVGPDARRAIELVQQVDDIVVSWQTLLDHFDFLRNREAQHTVLTSQILSRVMSWTVIEAILVIGMAVGQVLYWRKFFEQRRYL